MLPVVLALLVLALSALAAPFQKRIAQVISGSTTQWEAACLTASNNSPQCNTISVNASSTLLATAGLCDQQNVADTMIDFAKTLTGDTSEVVRLAQIFVQQPRDSQGSLSVPYCQSAPRNAELNGLFQCQFAGTNKETFVLSPRNLVLGDVGTIPFGLSAPLNPAGSCPANPSGPVPDGRQLVEIVGDRSSGEIAKASGQIGGKATAAGERMTKAGGQTTKASGQAIKTGVSGGGVTASPTINVASAAAATCSTGNHGCGKATVTVEQPTADSTSTGTQSTPTTTTSVVPNNNESGNGSGGEDGEPQDSNATTTAVVTVAEEPTQAPTTDGSSAPTAGGLSPIEIAAILSLCVAIIGAAVRCLELLMQSRSSPVRAGTSGGGVAGGASGV